MSHHNVTRQQALPYTHSPRKLDLMTITKSLIIAALINAASILTGMYNMSRLGRCIVYAKCIITSSYTFLPPLFLNRSSASSARSRAMTLLGPGRISVHSPSAFHTPAFV